MKNKLSLSYIKEFLHYEATGGWLLFFAGLLAIIVANSTWSDNYFQYFNSSVTVKTSSYSTTFSRQWLIDEGLMTFFFLLVSLEIKRNFLTGELKNWKKRSLPAIAALGGMLIPALIFIICTPAGSLARNGWAIPCATDIAFALGVLSLLGNRVPEGLKIFLTTLAILDDLGAITIIAVYYTNSLSMEYLLLSLLVISILAFCNHKRINSLVIYSLLGVLLWVFLLKSGLHATMAGVILAFTIPISNNKEESLLHRLEKSLHPWVVLLILPLFAFANAGINLTNLSFEAITQPIVIGVILGLLIGKPLGVTIFSYFAVKMKIASLPNGINWGQMFGVSIVCGIGFTMSLFINLLAFSNHSELADAGRLGVLIGSLLAGAIGYLFLSTLLRR